MKAFTEEYGSFIVAVLIGLILLGLLFGLTIENTAFMQKLIPDERNRTLSFLSNDEVMDTSKIPQMDIADSITVLINPVNKTELNFMDPKFVRNVTDGEGGKVVHANYVPQKYARKPSALRKGYLNIIGYDAVNTQVKGDYKVTYQFENSEGYKNVHDMVVVVRSPYIPLEYIKAVGTQFINTGYIPSTGSTAVTIEYAPSNADDTNMDDRQDIIWTGTDPEPRMKFGIFVQKKSDGKMYWGYAYDQKEVLTNIVADGKTEVTLDGKDGKFIVGNHAPIDIERNVDEEGNVIENVGNGYISIFKKGEAFGNLYTVQVIENEEVRANMFAAYCKTTNTFGLWDTVSWSAFINSGDFYPDFTHGQEIEE